MLFLAYDVGAIYIEGPTPINQAALTADVICAVIPYGTGGGLAARIGGEAAVAGLMRLPVAVRALQLTEKFIQFAELNNDNNDGLSARGNGSSSSSSNTLQDSINNVIEPNFENQKSLVDHFNKHKGEFDYKTVEEYLEGARSLVNGGEGIETFIRPKGDKLFYNTKTEEFGILSKDGVILTYFKPEKKYDYWLRQIGKQK